MAILSTAKIVGMLACAKRTGKQVMNTAGERVAEVVEDFVSGFAGHGWKIWEYVSGKWKLEIDSIVVRGTMTIFELLIQKIRAVKGALGITQACGKIKTAELDANKTNWLVTIEDEMSFVPHDIIRCQNWTGSTLKGYWVEISEVKKMNGVDTIVIPVSEFAGGIGYTDGMEAVKADLSSMTRPAPGDEIIQFGNSVNANRQSAIYLHADEGGQPAIDILFGIKSKSFAGCVKQRMGGDIPGTDGLKGFYCENGMIKGVDTTGHTVYCIYPDGSAMFGDGSAQFNTDRSGHIAGGAIKWVWDDTKKKYVCTMGDVLLTWDNLSDETKENLKGEPGGKGDTGGTGADGVNGKDGVSIIFKGDFSSHPANPQNGWSYYNTTDKKSYVYQSGAWYRMTVDGVGGANGKDGLSVDYKGDLANPPDDPQKNWCYRDTDNGRVYLYNGSAWVLMVADGSNGTDGANGSNGLSVFITYNDSEDQPATPVGNGAAGGWHTAPNMNCVWMSQKVAADALSGKWGVPIRIKGNTGPQGVPGTPGKDGKVLYTWIRYADTSTGGGISNDPTGKTYMGLAHNKETATESNTPSDYTWSRFRGADGINGVGIKGDDGKTYYTWIAYSDNANGSGMYQVPNDNTQYIGLAANKDTATESNTPGDYIWSKFKGEDGTDGTDGKDANLLPWIEAWNGYATELGADYIVTPRMFSGTRSEDGKLTGIAQGKECLTDAATGEKRTGIFALVDDEIVFELDPIKKKYLFKGSISTVPTHVNKDNILQYVTLVEFETSTQVYIDIGKTGLNIQLDSDLSLNNTQLWFSLPRETKHEGSQVNICVAVQTYTEPEISDIYTFDIKGGWKRANIGVSLFKVYTLKCIVFMPNEDYPYDLIDGKAIEWILLGEPASV